MSLQTRREFLKPAATMASSTIPYSRGAGARPNMLFALADDWMWPLASIAGAPRSLMPVLTSSKSGRVEYFPQNVCMGFAPNGVSTSLS